MSRRADCGRAGRQQMRGVRRSLHVDGGRWRTSTSELLGRFTSTPATSGHAFGWYAIDASALGTSSTWLGCYPTVESSRVLRLRGALEVDCADILCGSQHLQLLDTSTEDTAASDL